MSIGRITEKYTGHRISPDLLLAAYHHDGIAAELAEAINRAVSAIAATDVELNRLAESITDHVTAVTTNITAGAGRTTPSLNALGELQAYGPRFDALTAVRADRIGHLRVLVRLWQHLPEHAHT